MQRCVVAAEEEMLDPENLQWGLRGCSLTKTKLAKIILSLC